MEEESWVRLCREGHEEGYASLFDHYEASARRLAYAITGNRALADDATQEAFIQAFRAIRNLRPGARFGPWFYAIVANRARRLNSRNRWAFPLAVQGDVPDPKAEKTLEAMEWRAEIWQAVKQLPVGLRVVLALRFAMDLSESETAAVLRIPPGTVKSRTNRAKELLRRKLAESVEEGTVCQ